MNISIEYCMQWNYEPKALSLRESIQKQFGIEAKLIKSSGGVFEVTLNNSLIFSKKDADTLIYFMKKVLKEDAMNM